MWRCQNEARKSIDEKVPPVACMCHQNNRKIQSTCRSETDKSKHNNSIQLYNMASSMAPKPPLTHRKQQFITNLYICTFVTQLYIKFLDNTFSAMPPATHTSINRHGHRQRVLGRPKRCDADHREKRRWRERPRTEDVCHEGIGAR